MPQYARGTGYETDSNPTHITADGNITVHPKRITHHVLQAAAPLALTISLPGPNDDGKIVTFAGLDVIGHVITQPVDGFNHKGAAGTATWSGITQGDSLMLIAHAGSWWTLSKNVVVVA